MLPEAAASGNTTQLRRMKRLNDVNASEDFFGPLLRKDNLGRRAVCVS